MISKELSIVIFSHLYPRANNPSLGIFIHAQVRAIQRMGCRVQVISPVPMVPHIFQTTVRRRGYVKVPLATTLDDVPVNYPRYLTAPTTFLHGPTGILMPLTLLGHLKKMIALTGADLLHSHCATPDGYAAVKMASQLGIPVVCSLRGDDINMYPRYWPLTRWQTQKVLLKADAVVAVSACLKNEANMLNGRQTLCVNKNGIQVIHNGCDLELFKPLPEAGKELRDKFGVSEDTILFLFIGEIEQRKGIHELLDAFSNVVDRSKKVKLWLIGEQSDLSFTKGFSSLPDDIKSRLLYLGRIEHGQIPRYLSAADVFVLPTYNEGFPNVVREAMSCGLPVIATAVGGIPEVVVDGLNGLLIPPKDSASLVSAMQQMINYSDRRRSYGKAAYSYATTHFSWERNAQAHLELYRSLSPRT
jgi:teichuronic acid biosynthesis glycosyltransferase TuaC